MNANLLFVWRRLYSQAVLTEEATPGKAALLPVKVSTPTLLPSERAKLSKIDALLPWNVAALLSPLQLAA